MLERFIKSSSQFTMVLELIVEKTFIVRVIVKQTSVTTGYGCRARGKIVEMGEKQEIFSNPTHPYTQALMCAIPVPNPERQRIAVELKGEVLSAINVPPGCRFHTRCPYAEEGCKQAEPELMAVGPGHLVACYKIKT